jgi:flagellar biogenesis protein FliO
MLLLALFFIGTDYMRTVIDNVIFAMLLTFILILLLLIILIFIVYKIWAYIWNKKQTQEISEKNLPSE